MKKYNTKKRKQERNKKLWLLASVVVGVAVIKVSALGATVPLDVQTYDLVQTPTNQSKTSEIAEMSLQEHVWKLLTEEGGLTFEQATRGMAIVNCESRWDKMAIGTNPGSLDLGLWQLNTHFQGDNISREDMFDVYASTRYAIGLFRSWGDSWGAWACDSII